MRTGRWPPTRARLIKLMEQAIVDAYGESEQRAGFFAMLQDGLALPFETDVLGLTVTVERIHLTDSNEIIAVCRRGRRRQAISILGLPLPESPPAGAEWIEAYRCWVRGL